MRDGPAFASSSTMSAPFSPIITAAALVLPDTTVGMIEASMTRNASKAAHAQPLVDHGVRIAAHAAGGEVG